MFDQPVPHELPCIKKLLTSCRCLWSSHLAGKCELWGAKCKKKIVVVKPLWTRSRVGGGANKLMWDKRRNCRRRCKDQMKITSRILRNSFFKLNVQQYNKNNYEKHPSSSFLPSFFFFLKCQFFLNSFCWTFCLCLIAS